MFITDIGQQNNNTTHGLNHESIIHIMVLKPAPLGTPQ
jgi:hypothetical protein